MALWKLGPSDLVNSGVIKFIVVGGGVTGGGGVMIGGGGVGAGGASIGGGAGGVELTPPPPPHADRVRAKTTALPITIFWSIGRDATIAIPLEASERIITCTFR